MYRFLSQCSPPPTKKSKTKEDTLVVHKNMRTRNENADFLLRGKRADPGSAMKIWSCFVQTSTMCNCRGREAGDLRIKIIRTLFLLAAQQSSWESIKLHQDSNNHIKAKSSYHARDNPLETKAHKITTLPAIHWLHMAWVCVFKLDTSKESSIDSSDCDSDLEEHVLDKILNEYVWCCNVHLLSIKYLAFVWLFLLTIFLFKWEHTPKERNLQYRDTSVHKQKTNFNDPDSFYIAPQHTPCTHIYVRVTKFVS